MRSRPIIQLNITVSNAAAITIGSQPPSKNFTKFEERKTTSIISSTKNIGIKIKSPIELMVGIYRTVPYSFNKPQQALFLQKMMGQVLLYPVNVAGWKGNTDWIDSNTLMFRLKLSSMLLNNAIINLDAKGDIEDTFEAYYTKRKNAKHYLKMDISWNIFEKEINKQESMDRNSEANNASLKAGSAMGGANAPKPRAKPKMPMPKKKPEMMYGGMAKKKMMKGGRMMYNKGGEVMPKAKPC